MLQGWVVILVALLYLSLLFAIAYYGDKRADDGRSLANNPYIYALSIAVYCTSWTYYGSVGRAASSGLDFLPIYLGPTLVFLLWWFVLGKIIRITKVNRITSIADFIASRYGKSTLLGGVVTIIAVLAIMPYISLQLKAVSTSFNVVMGYPAIIMPTGLGDVHILHDTAFHVALVLAIFTILFGTRHIDASEHHEGMVVAIAFESIVKLAAFLSIGVFVTYGLYDGFGDLFAQAKLGLREYKSLITLGTGSSYTQWVTMTLLSMAAIICLPRQFQVTAIENLDERHLDKAVWLFPLYLLTINIFVLPIAFGGLLLFSGDSVDADTFVLTVPMALQQEGLALFAFIGGLSAATGMVIVATIALSTMVCNDLIMPVLLRLTSLRLNEKGDLGGLLLGIRRSSIVFIILIGYAYFRYIGESYTLVSVGLLSFTAAAQFAPVIIGGILWRGGTRKGALAGLCLGFLVWAYTLLLPSLARSGWIPPEFVEQGAFGIALLKPYELFGLNGIDHISHALFWSMLANIGAYVAISLASRQTALERIQASLFVDVFRRTEERNRSPMWRGTATFSDLYNLVVRFVGRAQADRAFANYAERLGLSTRKLREADPALLHYTEQLLAGAIGAASARVMIGTVVKGELASMDEVMEILDETSQVIEYSHRLEEKSRELEIASAELQAANERLKELDRMKDDFLSTVSHELRTPLTSIRSFSEILFDQTKLSASQRKEFLGIIIKESERLTRLINQLLDLAKLEAGRGEWHMMDIDPREVIGDAIAATSSLMAENRMRVDVQVPDQLRRVHADRDRFIQVIVNLLSNAVKFSDRVDPRVWISAHETQFGLCVSVADNGLGIPVGAENRIFEKFEQASQDHSNKPVSTGLGLPICRQIVEYFGGRIWVENRAESGARFVFIVPFADELAMTGVD
jgi:Na+/proline symporter/nitrogen-specific signal transduction histidine kinase